MCQDKKKCSKVNWRPKTGHISETSTWSTQYHTPLLVSRPPNTVRNFGKWDSHLTGRVFCVFRDNNSTIRPRWTQSGMPDAFARSFRPTVHGRPVSCNVLPTSRLERAGHSRRHHYYNSPSESTRRSHFSWEIYARRRRRPRRRNLHQPTGLIFISATSPVLERIAVPSLPVACLYTGPHQQTSMTRTNARWILMRSDTRAPRRDC